VKKIFATIISLLFVASVSFAVVGCSGNEGQKPEEAIESPVPQEVPVPDEAEVPAEVPAAIPEEPASEEPAAPAEN
jgi:hypothetical protein